MQFLAAFLALGLLFASADAQAIEDPSDQDAALAGARSGALMSFGDIRERVSARVGGRFIGCDCDPNSARYTMRYLRGNKVVEVDVDARTGNILGKRD